MINPKITVGEKSVVSSGSVLVPADETSMRICLDDLEFIIKFTSNVESKPEIFFNGDGKALTVEFNNVQASQRLGFTNSFISVGTYNFNSLHLVTSVQYLPNLAKIVNYTFATTLNVGAGDGQ